MKIAGIICEYNPLHTGHVHHMEETRRLLGVDTVLVCAMSGNFVQRGDFAVCRKHVRAAAAVRSGVDLVLELAAPYATAGAEAFALGGIATLQAAGVETVSFGSECGDVAALGRVVECLTDNAFPDALRAQLAGGVTFAAARQAAVRQLLGAEAALLAQPNNILGVEYLKSIARMGNKMTALAVQRVGAKHDGAAGGGFASASHLRALLRAGEEAGAYLPPAMAALYAREAAAGRAPAGLAHCERAVLARLRTMTEEDFAAYDDGGEGLYRRVYAAVRGAQSVEEILAAAKTKRYPYARLRRLLLRAYLGITAADVPEQPPYLRVLACNERGRAVLSGLRGGAVPVLTKSADVRMLGTAAQRLFALEARCTELYALACPKIAAGDEWTRGPVIV